MDGIDNALIPAKPNKAPYSGLQLQMGGASAAPETLTDRSLSDISGSSAFVKNTDNGQFGVIDGTKFYDASGNTKPRSDLEAIIKDALDKRKISLSASDITDMVTFVESHGSAFVDNPKDNVYILASQGSHDLLDIYTNIREHPELYANIDMSKINIDQAAYNLDAGRAFSNFHEVAHVENDKYLHFRPFSSQTIKGLNDLRMDDTNGDIFATMKMAQLGNTSFAPEQAKMRLIEAFHTGPGIYQARRSPEYDAYARYTNMTHNSYTAVMGTTQLLNDVQAGNWSNVESLMTKAYQAYDPGLTTADAASQAHDFAADLKSKGGMKGMNEDSMRKLSAVLTSYYTANSDDLIAMMAYARGGGTVEGADQLIRKMSSDGSGLSADQTKYLKDNAAIADDILKPGRVGTAPATSPSSTHQTRMPSPGAR